MKLSLSIDYRVERKLLCGHKKNLSRLRRGSTGYFVLPVLHTSGLCEPVSVAVACCKTIEERKEENKIKVKQTREKISWQRCNRLLVLRAQHDGIVF